MKRGLNLTSIDVNKNNKHRLSGDKEN